MTGLRSVFAVFLLAGAVALGTGCGGGDDTDDEGSAGDSGAPGSAGRSGSTKEPAAGTLALTSRVFAEGAGIPVPFTCDAEDVSPPLTWSEPPAATQSLTLICDDPDAPGKTWVHWVLFNLPSSARDLPSGVEAGGTHADGSRHGTNDFGEMAYGGPCPPAGGSHRYVFRLYALDTTLDLEPGATKDAVLAAMEGHVLAEGRLTGTYARP